MTRPAQVRSRIICRLGAGAWRVWSQRAYSTQDAARVVKALQAKTTKWTYGLMRVEDEGA